MFLRRPYGVVAIIMPWNAPVVFSSKKVAPAVAAGKQSCTRVSRKLHSWDVTSTFGLRSAISAWRDQRPVGHGHVAGNALAEHMTARCISLMGSTRIGRAYQIAFAKSNSKSVIYDLGGNSLACAFEDADIR